MSIGKIAPARRSRLRLHGWLLLLWAASVGLLTSVLLLHVFHVQSMAIRYAIGAAIVYLLGFVFTGWWYAKWMNGQKAQKVADLPVHATLQEQLEYDQEQEAIRKRFNWLDFLNVGGGDDPIGLILNFIVFAALALFVLLLVPYLPMLATEALAGYLAEIVLEFVIGGFVMRHILKPKSLDDYWSFVVGKTWLAGLCLVVVSGVSGYVLQQFDPTARTLLQLIR